MTDPIFLALTATLGTWLLTALGAAVVFFIRSPDCIFLDSVLGFASGIMIAASFWSLLLPAVEWCERASAFPGWFVVTAGFLLGAGFMLASERFSFRLNRIKAGNAPVKLHQSHRIRMLVLSISLHNIPEGLAVGVAFGAIRDPSSEIQRLLAAYSVALGIGIQNFPEGAAVSLPLFREGYSRTKSFLIGQATALAEPIAGILGAMLVLHIQALLPWALSFAAGAMILVAVHELIPECQKSGQKKPYLSTGGIILGFSVMTLLDVMLG